MKLLSIIAMAFVAVTPALAGINCHGGVFCSWDNWEPPAHRWPWQHDASAKIHEFVSMIPDNLLVPWGHPIACSKLVCAFIQARGSSPREGLLGAEVKRLSAELINHGCQGCGSVPVGYPKNNDDAYGLLTYNVGNKLCNTKEVQQFHEYGICPEFANVVNNPDISKRALRMEKDERRRIVAEENGRYMANFTLPIVFD